MTQWLIIDIIVFLAVTLLTGFSIPKILNIAFSKKLFDEVNARKVHKGLVPRLGGIAFVPNILFSLTIIYGICSRYVHGFEAAINGSSVSLFCFVCCAMVILYIVGVADDLVGLKYSDKFAAQIASGAIVVAGGISITSLHGFFGIYELPTVVSVVLSIFMMVFIVNAINLIDGIDGLASGLSILACATYGYMFITVGLHLYAMLAFATLGALVPFFYFNVFGSSDRHRKIFMGDTGALTIGLILSVLSIRICMIDDNMVTINPVVIAFSPLLIPCLDVVRVYMHRIRNHRNPFLPDKNHIHHKLMALGLSQHASMIIIVSASGLLTMFNYCLSSMVPVTMLIIFDVLLWTVPNLFLTRAIRHNSTLLL